MTWTRTERGWRDGEAPGHEGRIVAWAGLPPQGTTAARVAEARPRMGSGGERRSIDIFQVTCLCGWRSMRFRVPSRASGAPLAKCLERSLEHAAWLLWRQHWRVPEALGERSCVRVPLLGARQSDREGRWPGAHLELGDDAGGPRFFLDGAPVHAGSSLEILLADDRWLRGHYEYEITGDEIRPLFYVTVPCKTGPPDWNPDLEGGVSAPEAHFEIPEDALLRWRP